MSNAWINHVRNFRRQNRHLTSYRQLLQQARQSYNGGEPPVQRQGGEPPVAPVRRQGGGPPDQRQGGEPVAPSTAKSLQSMLQSLRGGGITGMESRSSLASSATRVGGRSRRNRRKTRRSRR